MELPRVRSGISGGVVSRGVSSWGTLLYSRMQLGLVLDSASLGSLDSAWQRELCDTHCLLTLGLKVCT